MVQWQLLALWRKVKMFSGELYNWLACSFASPLPPVLVVSEAVGVAKPDPAIFQTALQRLHCAASEVVMVGDSWPADILGATNLGVRAIWLNRHGQPCPDSTLAKEIHAFEPLDTVIAQLLSD